MEKKKDLKLGKDCLPFRINGCEVEVFFPSAYDTEPETRPEDLEKTLIAAYQVNQKPVDDGGFRMEQAMRAPKKVSGY